MKHAVPDQGADMFVGRLRRDPDRLGDLLADDPYKRVVRTLMQPPEYVLFHLFVPVPFFPLHRHIDFL
jgi:hypothetical protein